MYRLEEHGNSKTKEISFQKFKDIISQNGTSDRKLHNLLSKSKLDNQILNRADDDFIKYIDTTKIVLMQIAGKTTYSMKIETNQEDGVNFYNLLVYEKENELKQIVLKYLPDANFNPQTPWNFSGTMMSLDEEGNTKDIEIFEYNKILFVICGFNFIPMCICDAGNAHCSDDPECTAGGGRVTGFEINPVYCFVNDGGGGDDGGIEGSEGGPGGDTTVGHTGTGSNGVATTVVYFSPEEIRIKKFDKQLTVDQKNCINSLPNDVKQALLGVLNPNPQLIDGCETNPPTEETQFNYVEDILANLCVAGNPNTPQYTLSNYPGMDEAMPFEWWKDKEYIKSNFQMKSDSDLNGAPRQPNLLEIALFIIYPSAAIIHRQNSNLAYAKTNELVANNTLTQAHNGKADSYRHAFWNARDSADFGPFITKLFTDAHEKGSCNVAVETEMDLFNNQQGITIGNNYNFFTSDSSISNDIITAILYGNLLYLTPLAISSNDDGIIINGVTQLLPTNQ